MNFLFIMLPDPSIKALGMQRSGVAYVAASLMSSGRAVFGLDCNLLETSQYAAEIQAAIERHSIHVVCVGAVADEYNMVRVLCRLLKKFRPDIRIMVGGGLITASPEVVMSGIEADFGIIGQGEVTICELADALEGKRHFREVDGLIYRDANGAVVRNRPREDLDSIDDLPYPAYGLFQFEQYVKQYHRLNIVASRSCPYRCTFCYHTSGAKYVQRNMDSVFQEIDYWLERYEGIRYITLVDELFSANFDRVEEFCRRIKPYHIRFRVNLRVDDVTRKMLTILRDAGCEDISYGLESADDRILKSMKKSTTIQQIASVLEMTRKMKICGVGLFIFGDPAETIETANRTLAWWREHPQYPIKLAFIKIYPGTVLYDIARERGLILDELQYLRDGLPILNISQLTDDQFAWIGQQIFWGMQTLGRNVGQVTVMRMEETYCQGTVQCGGCGSVLIFEYLYYNLPARVICTGCAAELIFSAKRCDIVTGAS